MLIRYPAPESADWALMQWNDIPSSVNAGQVYLRRLRIAQTPWVSLYLHWISEPDPHRDPHDHPWTFWSFILRGGYSEDVFERIGGKPIRCYWRRWTLHRMPVTKAHQITTVQPGTVTLVLTGRRVREWCFWTENRLVPWREYLRTNKDSGDLAPEA
jgi:hypothetical protein